MVEGTVRRCAVVVLLGASIAAVGTSSARAAFPGANGRIVFDTAHLFFDGRGSSDIFSVRPNGSGLRQLTHMPKGASAWQPRVSPDGGSILFVVTSDGANDQVWLMRADGSHAHPLLREREWVQGVGGFAQGRVVYSRCGAYVPGFFTCHLVSVRRDGSDRRTLVGGTWHPIDPVVAADGTIAYLSDKGGYDPTVWRVDGDGAHPRRIGPPFEAERLSWAPDSAHLVFGGNFHAHEIGIYTMAADGSDLRRVVSGGSFPTWSPNGRWLLYWSERRHELERARPDGTDISAVIDHRFGSLIGFSDWAVAR
jgi:Tol biopolymer transport system component